MNLKIEDDIVYNGEGKMIAVITDATPEEKQMLVAGSEAIESVQEFVEDVNKGTFKPKRAFNKFETFLRKYQLTA